MSNRQIGFHEPSLRSLAYVLRHSELWPAGFEWGYSSGVTCAMGLAHRLWPEAIVAPKLFYMHTVFEIPLFVAEYIFIHGFARVQCVEDVKRITPAMVAEQIEAYVAIQDGERSCHLLPAPT